MNESVARASKTGMTRHRMRSALLAGLLLGVWTVESGAQDLVVAAASSMRYPVMEILERFETETGSSTRLSLGSSGSFFAQIANGAPFDVYLAADMDYPRELERAGLVLPGSLDVYGTGRLVLWVPEDSAIDVERLGMDAVRAPGVRRIAIANPRLAPYGRAAVEAMGTAGLYDEVSATIARAENVAQVAQFVSTGAADIGFLAMSLVIAPETPPGRMWAIPQAMHSPIEQGVVVLARSRQAGHEDLARRFVDVLRGPVGRSILEKYGFEVP